MTDLLTAAALLEALADQWDMESLASMSLDTAQSVTLAWCAQDLRKALAAAPSTPLRAWLIEQSQQATAHIDDRDGEWHRGYRHAIDATLTRLGGGAE